MPATALLQIKIDPKLKQLLEQLAQFYGITLSSFVKMKLTETSRLEREKIQKTVPVTRDAEDDFIVRHEKEMIKTLTSYLADRRNIDEVVHVTD